MARRKAAEPEIITPARTKVVNARHKIEYDAPVAVPADDPADDDLVIDDEALEEENERKRKRKTKNARDEREDIRKEMETLGVVSPGDLKLMIEKYKHSESAESGTLADKIYCTKYACTREHIMNNDYLDVAARWGAGRYWFTLRHKNKIVKPWEREITAPGSNGAPVQNPNDPTSPHVVFQMPENGHAIPADPFKEAERALSLVEKYNRAFGRLQPQGEALPQRSEEETLTTAILKQPEVIENVIGSVMKRFKVGGAEEDGPTWPAVVMRAIESGQAPTIIQTIIREFTAPFKNMWGNNGHAQTQAQGMENAPPADETNMQRMPPSEARPEMEAQAQGQQMTAEDMALSIVVNHCAGKAHPQIAASRLIALADDLNRNEPELSIDGYLIAFTSMSADQALDVVRGLPNCKQVAELPHAKAWTAELQRIIKNTPRQGANNQ